MRSYNSNPRLQFCQHSVTCTIDTLRNKWRWFVLVEVILVHCCECVYCGQACFDHYSLKLRVWYPFVTSIRHGVEGSNILQLLHSCSAVAIALYWVLLWYLLSVQVEHLLASAMFESYRHGQQLIDDAKCKDVTTEQSYGDAHSTKEPDVWHTFYNYHLL